MEAALNCKCDASINKVIDNVDLALLVSVYAIMPASGSGAISYHASVLDKPAVPD